MILYHGLTLAIEKLQILRTEIGRDFGFAFYMRKEDAVARLKFEQINNQIAFCSDKALQCLEYRGTL